MVSATQQSSRIRRRKARTCGTKNKRFNRANGTPAFPLHQEGYPATAADAKPGAVNNATITVTAVYDGKPIAHEVKVTFNVAK